MFGTKVKYVSSSKTRLPNNDMAEKTVPKQNIFSHNIFSKILANHYFLKTCNILVVKH